MRQDLSATLLVILGCLCGAPLAAVAQPQATDRPWLDRQALENGDVSLEVVKDGPYSLLDAGILIDAPVTTIWDILKACEIAPEYVPKIVACRSIEVLDGGRGELFIQTVKPAFFLPSFEHVFRMQYDEYSKIDISRVSGPIKYLESTWHLEPQADGKILLSYELKLDPGIPVPRAFVRATLRRDMPVVLLAIKERSERAARSDGQP